MGTNYIAPIWRMPRNANKDKLSNYSIKFGTNEVINFDSYTLPNKYTISIWLNPDASYGTDYGYYIGGAPTAGQGFAIGQGGNAYGMQIGELYFYFGGYASTLSGVVLPQNEWSHVLLVVDKTFGSQGKIETYLNNNLESTTTSFSSTPVSSFTSISIIGANKSNASQWDFSGEISQCCIFDYNLNVNQRTYLYNLNNPMAITSAEPVLYWPLGDNSNPNAEAGYPNISVGADSVFEFGGADYIDAGSSLGLIGTGVRTFSVWLKTSTTSTQTVLGTRNVNTNGWVIQIELNSILFYNVLGGANKGIYTTAANLTDGKWHHLMIVRAGSANNRIYVDGSPQTLNTTTFGAENLTDPQSSKDLLIGAGYNTGGTLYRFFNGQMSNVAIWNSDQSSEISNIYNSGVPATSYTNTPTAWYKLNQSANWEADTANNWQIPDNRSAYPQSFDFVPNNRILFSSDDSYKLQEFSVSLWFKPDVSASDPIFLNGAYSYGSQGFEIFQYFGGIRVRINSSGQAISGLTIGEWHHIFVSYDGTTMKYSVNGAAIQTGTLTGTINYNNYNGIVVGRSVYGHTNGKISNVMFWDSDISASSSLTYNNGVPLTTAIASDNLKGWWKLDNTELFGGGNWSIKNQKYPANWESALDFNRSEYDNLNATAVTDYDTGDVSLSLWVFKDDSSTSGVAFNNSYSSGNAGFSVIIDSSERVYIKRSTRTKGAATGYRSIGFKIKKWHHIALTYNDTTGALRTFLDGQFIQEFTATSATPAASSNFCIGGRGPGSGNASYFLDGKVSNINIFSSKLEDSDINTLYNNGSPLTDLSSFTTLGTWWKLDNLTTGIQDEIGSIDLTNDGATKVNTFVSSEAGASYGMTEQNLINNNVSVFNGESDGMNSTNLVQSNLTRKVPFSNYSFNFDSAQSDYFSCGSNVLFNTTRAFSFSGWVNLDSYSTTYPSIIRIATDQTQDFIIGLSNDSNYAGVNFGAYITFAKGRTAGNISGDFINTWKHICLIFDGVSTGTLSSYKVYIDGVEVALTSAGSFAGSTGGVTTIGYGGYSNRFFNGKISNISLFDNELTQDDIINLYNNGVPQDLNNFRITPIAWWPMDERSSYYDGTDWVIRDLENGNDGQGANTGNVDDLVGNAPGSEASGTGSNLVIGDLKNNMYNSDKNAYSINMADYADGITNPANSGRSTDTP